MSDKHSKQSEIISLGEGFVLSNDHVSDRIRCDFPQVDSGAKLADTLIQKAEECGRGKIISIVTEPLVHDLQRSGFYLAAQLPKVYDGKEDIFIMSYNVDENRYKLANPKEVGRVEGVLSEVLPPTNVSIESLSNHSLLESVNALSPNESGELSELIAKTFQSYPTPSFEREYVRSYIEGGNLFHGLRDNSGTLVSCASADIVADAKTAELTDCATLPEYRGRGYMRAILVSLMQSLHRDKRFPTAFTMARARVPGINVLFKQLGFRFCGRLSRSCLIGDGLEDMNIWARRLF